MILSFFVIFVMPPTQTVQNLSFYFKPNKLKHKLIKSASSVLYRPSPPSSSILEQSITVIGMAHFDVPVAVRRLEALIEVSLKKKGGVLKVQSTAASKDNFLEEDEEIAPPIFGFVLGHLFEIVEDKEGLRPFLKYVYPKLINFHKLLYETRDLAEEGLLGIVNASELGIPQSLFWSNQEREGKDLWIQEPLFNAFLAYSNEALIKIGAFLGEDLQELIEWNEWTTYSFNDKLWNEKTATFHPYDFRQSNLSTENSLLGYLSLISGIPTQDQAECMLKKLESSTFNREGFFLCPSHEIPKAHFDFNKTGNAAILPCLNWLLYYGLIRYDMYEMAEKIRRDTLFLIGEYGFCHAFDSRKDALANLGIGKPNNPSTAAVLIDFCQAEYPLSILELIQKG